MQSFRRSTVMRQTRFGSPRVSELKAPSSDQTSVSFGSTGLRRRRRHLRCGASRGAMDEPENVTPASTEGRARAPQLTVMATPHKVCLSARKTSPEWPLLSRMACGRWRRVRWLWRTRGRRCVAAPCNGGVTVSGGGVVFGGGRRRRRQCDCELSVGRGGVG